MAQAFLAFPPNPSAPTTNVYSHNGPVAQGEPLSLLFWGTAWTTLVNPTKAGLLSDAFAEAVRRIVNGPWMAGLRQYGVTRSVVLGPSLVTTWTDPPQLPDTFDSSDVKQMLLHQLSFLGLPTNQMYVVFMPPNTKHEDDTVGGAHSTIAGVWFGFVCWDQSFDVMMVRCSHEISEMCSDPESNAWRAHHAPHEWAEIADICSGQDGYTRGVWVESYWSNRDQACIIPTAWSLRHTLAWANKQLNGNGVRSLNPGPSIRNFIMSV
jgi:hypothetical protein